MPLVQSASRPRLFRIARRVADRFSPKVATDFMAAMAKIEKQINAGDLRSAVASGSAKQVEAAIAQAGNFRAILEGGDLEKTLRGTATATGSAGADVLSSVRGLAVEFNRMSPRVVMFARQQTAQLVVEVSEHVRESIRIVTALGAGQGLTVEQQARAVREVVGLPSQWANAPLNLRADILNGDVAAATNRRLSATEKAQIRSRIAAGTVDDAFLAEMEKTYAERLLNRRALNIAGTETKRAAHAGQVEGWKQAIQQKALPKTTREYWVVTPDDRLSEEHAEIPGMNPDGVEIDGWFDTPEGQFQYPPIRPNCRCGIALGFPGFRGLL